MRRVADELQLIADFEEWLATTLFTDDDPTPGVVSIRSAYRALFGEDALPEIYGYKAGQDAKFPYVRYEQFLPGLNTLGQGARPLMLKPEYRVYVVTRYAPDDNALQIANRLGSLLGVTSSIVFKSVRLNVAMIAPIAEELPGETEEIFYMRRGGHFRCWLSRAA